MAILATALALVSVISVPDTKTTALEQPEPSTPFALSSLFAPDPLVAAPAPLLGGSAKLGYTYAELNYVYTDLDGVPGTQNGIDATVSWNFLLGIYVQGSYAEGRGDADTETYKIGAGYHLPLGDKLDVFGLISYEHDYIKLNGASATGDGYEFDVGARFMLFEDLEVNGQLEFNHVNDDNFGVEVGTRYYLAGPLSLGASIETIDQDFRFAAGVRATF